MEAAGEHPVPSGPLAVRWLAYDAGRPRAGALGTARLAFENAGTVPWPPTGERRVCLGYHWLDELGNPIVWDGLWTALPREVSPGERVEAELAVRGPLPPGPYRLAFDLVAEDRYWFSELGNAPLERPVLVAPRIERRALAVRGGDPGVQEEPLVPEAEAEAIAYLAPGVVPAPDWSRRILDAHAEGYAAVGGSIAVDTGLLRRPPPALAPYAPGGGRNPAFEHPLLCPSVVHELEPDWAEPIEGLPALKPPPDEPWLYDGRVTVRLRSGRRRG
ncbi:MAG TPA: hypothetical protein VE596_01570 [Gaiellaceae bacterium]|jgi:hypothetical protein|nr:hypothetical protein [Gaiellaceae bacterium]